MKIVYIASKYDYGDKSRGYSIEHYNFYGSLVKMNGGVHRVVYFPFDEIMADIGRDEMNNKLLETIEEERPDLCFFFLFADEIKKETIKEITDNSGARTFNWFADDQWRFDSFSKHYAPCFSWVGTTDSKAPEKYRKIGYTNVIKTQWACNHFLYRPTNSEEKYGVTFVGQPHGSRKKILEKVEKETGIDIECWGFGWPNGRLSQEEMMNVFSNSEINLNLTENSHDSLLKSVIKIFIEKKKDKSISFVSPKHWADNLNSILAKRLKQMKARMFEVPGCGGFLITGEADNLRDYYEDGKEMVIYKDINDLIEKVRYYKNHPDERECIKKAGYLRTLKEHTYEKRFNEIFNVMGL